MTKLLRAAFALGLASLALIGSGCGSSSGSAGGDPASVIPASSFLYAEGTIDPQGSQEQAVRSILADLPGDGAPQDRLDNLIRDALRKDETNKLDWDKDVKPWLGDRAGAFVAGDAASFGKGEIAAALVVATTDGDAARNALEKDKAASAAHKRYRDVEYIVESDKGDVTAQGVVDGFLVAGTDAGMRAAIDAANGHTLADSDQFKKALSGVTDERLGFMYANVGGLLQLATQAAGSQFPGAGLASGLLAGKSVVITARAENQALIIEGKGSNGGGAAGGSAARDLIKQMPSDTWAAVALPGVGGAVKGFITGFASSLGGQRQLAEQLRTATGLDLQRDVVSWVGDVGVFVDGDTKSTLGGGLLIKSKNPAASKRALTRLAALAAKSGGGTRVAAARLPGAFGYQLRDSHIPRSVYMVQRGDNVVFTYGASQARAALAGGGLDNSPDFKRAAGGLGAAYTPLLYVGAAPILRVAEAFGASSDKDYAAAKPYLTILDYLVVGYSGKHARLRVGFKPHG